MTALAGSPCGCFYFENRYGTRIQPYQRFTHNTMGQEKPQDTQQERIAYEYRHILTESAFINLPGTGPLVGQFLQDAIASGIQYGGNDILKRLTDAQKDAIKILRACGLGYKTVANMLSISRDTVSSFCLRKLQAKGGESGDSQ